MSEMDAPTWKNMVVSWIIKSSPFNDTVKNELLSWANSLSIDTLHIFLSKLWKYCKQYNVIPQSWVFPEPDDIKRWLGGE